MCSSGDLESHAPAAHDGRNVQLGVINAVRSTCLAAVPA